MNVISSLQLKNFNKFGFLFPLNFLSIEDVEILNDLIDKEIYNLGGDFLLLKSGKLNQKYKFLDNVSKNSAILDVVEDLIGPNILCWAAGIFIKPPFSNLFTDWHQDYFYWGLSPSEAITVWIALSEVTLENGCMKFINDENYFTKFDHIETNNMNSMLSHGQSILGINSNSNVLNCTLNKGYGSIHHINTVHSSGPNNTNYERRGLVLRYIAAHVNQTIYKNDTAILVRGKPKKTNIKLVDLAIF